VKAKSEMKGVIFLFNRELPLVHEYGGGDLITPHFKEMINKQKQKG